MSEMRGHLIRLTRWWRQISAPHGTMPIGMVRCPRCMVTPVHDHTCVLCRRGGKRSLMVPPALAVEYALTPRPELGKWPIWLLKIQEMRARHDYE